MRKERVSLRYDAQVRDAFSIAPEFHRVEGQFVRAWVDSESVALRSDSSAIVEIQLVAGAVLVQETVDQSK